MLTQYEKDIIVRCAKKYSVSAIFLFGSSVEKGSEPNDIDLGVKGFQSHLFFKFYAELIKYLSKDVDLVDLSKKSLFSDLVEKKGMKIYG